MICQLCPRRCGALRTETQGEGRCGVGTLPLVSRAAPHFWEEPCISGVRGSGTVFFAGCALGCVFCQNEPISHHAWGRAMNAAQLCELFRRVEGLGVHNLSLVTGSHFAPVIAQALRMRPPTVPVVWNCGGYESPEILALLDGLVDIYLPDFKFFSPKISRLMCGAADYGEVALAALREMNRQTGAPIYDANGLMTRGTLVRHLILPGCTSDSIAVLDTIAGELPAGTPVSLMRQYTPMVQTGVQGLNRRLTEREYRRVRDHMLFLGLGGYEQEKASAQSAYTPAFMDDESTALFPDAEG